MLSRSRHLLLALAVSTLVLVAAVPAQAAETAASELVIIREGVVVDDDLYAVGSQVIVEGVVEGDLVAVAAEELRITGVVQGDVLAVAPTLEVSGDVGGSIRSLGGDLFLSGTVGQDLIAAQWRVDLDPGSSVAGDVLVWSTSLLARGSIGGDLTGTQRITAVEGEVGGAVDVTVSRLTVTGPLTVGDDFGYRSDREAEGLEQVEAAGVLVRKMPLPPNIRIRALSLLVRVLAVLALTSVAVVVAWSWPERTRRAAALAREQSLRSFTYGVVVMLSPLVLALIAWLIAALAPASASLPLLVVFVPLILAALGLVLVLSVVAGVPFAAAMGRLISGRLDLFGSVLVGALVIGSIWLLPWVGWLVPLIALPVGLGSWLVALRTGPVASS